MKSIDSLYNIYVGINKSSVAANEGLSKLDKNLKNEYNFLNFSYINREENLSSINKNNTIVDHFDSKLDKKFLIKKNDVVIRIIGNLRIVLIAEVFKENCTINSNYLIIRHKKDSVEYQKYIWYLLNNKLKQNKELKNRNESLRVNFLSKKQIAKIFIEENINRITFLKINLFEKKELLNNLILKKSILINKKIKYYLNSVENQNE